MKYFNDITDLDEAKLRYRKLAKQLHPDKGGIAVDFQKMQDEYKELLLSFQQKHHVDNNIHQPTPENELLNELGKIAKVLIKKQVPQTYLRQKVQRTNSVLNKRLLNGIVRILDEL